MDLEIENFFPRFKCKREIDPYCSINSGLNTHFIKAEKHELIVKLLYFCLKEQYKKIELHDQKYLISCRLLNQIQSVSFTIEV